MKGAVDVGELYFSPARRSSDLAPAPALETVSAKVGVKVAVTAVAAVSVTVQGAVPEQVPPLQPVKTDPTAGVAVRIRRVQLGKRVTHASPLSISAGVIDTVSLP